MFGSNNTSSLFESILYFWIVGSFVAKQVRWPKRRVQLRCKDFKYWTYLFLLILKFEGLNRNFVTCLFKVLTSNEHFKARFDIHNTMKSIDTIRWIGNPISNEILILLDAIRKSHTLIVKNAAAWKRYTRKR